MIRAPVYLRSYKMIKELVPRHPEVLHVTDSDYREEYLTRYRSGIYVFVRDHDIRRFGLTRRVGRHYEYTWFHPKEPRFELLGNPLFADLIMEELL